ncbi:MAG: universal stress protein [Chryseobacterium sp.]|nr:universal stress protein [Chryseobacterium sp.]
MNFKKILIAVDDSPFGMRAAHIGFDIAKQLSASVALVYVINEMKELPNPDLGVDSRELHATLLREADKTLDQYAEMYSDDIKMFRFTPEGDPKEEIIQIAAEWDADMIVIGSHGRSGISKIFMGSVADHVVRHSKVPVLLTPTELES